MSPRLALFPLLIPAALLGACANYNGGVESVHQPVVTRNNYALDLATSGGALPPGEAQRLAGWMQSLRLGYGDRVALDDPSGSGIVRDQVAGEVARYGLLLADEAPVTTGQIVPGTVRIVLTRSTAAVPGCPDYSRMYTPDYQQSTSSNYGCAVNSNLAAMIARPEDLVRGQPGAETSDPAVSSKAINTLRKATPTGAGGLKTESVGGSK